MKTLQERTHIALLEKIPSRMAEAELLCLKIRDRLQANDLSRHSFAVELLARECLSNAIIHGNENDDDKFIVLRLDLGREWIRLQVRDEGPGFRRRRIRENKLNSSVPSGRGLYLYELYAQRVQFNRLGNQVTLWISRMNQSGKEDDEMAAYVSEQNDQQGAVKMKGDLTAILVPELQASLKEMINKGAREVVFDLMNTAMLDSSGMGLLIAAANSLAPMGGNVRVTNVCPEIFRLLQSMRLTARLNVSARA
ncbi:MAG: ATP-binding protein [Terracidiphilus sp.]|jgi:serine/threonine-protein kinase RsbW